MKRGELWLVNMDPSIGREIRKTRPAVIVQNDEMLEKTGTVLVSPLTSKRTQRIYPSEVRVKRSGLSATSKILCSQTKAIDKRRILRRIGKIDAATNLELNFALKVTLDLY